MAILEYIKKSKNIVGFLNAFKKKNSLRISKFLKEDSIIFLKSKNKKDVILELVDVISSSKKIETNLFLKKIIDRENMISTSIGSGIAIPHAKLDELEDFQIAIGIQKKYKIDWDSIDKIPVNLVFLIAGPQSMQDEYLKLLSRLTLLVKNTEFRRKILKCQNTKDIFSLFSLF